MKECFEAPGYQRVFRNRLVSIYGSHLRWAKHIKTGETDVNFNLELDRTPSLPGKEPLPHMFTRLSRF